MSKYSDKPITRVQMRDIGELIDMLNGFGMGSIYLDHVQVGNTFGEIIGKVQYEDGQWFFLPRKHDKPAQLGE